MNRTPFPNPIHTTTPIPATTQHTNEPQTLDDVNELMEMWIGSTECEPGIESDLIMDCPSCAFHFSFLSKEIKQNLNGQCPLCLYIQLEQDGTNIEKKLNTGQVPLHEISALAEYDQIITSKFALCTLWINSHIRCNLNAILTNYVNETPTLLSLQNIEHNEDFLYTISTKVKAQYPPSFPLQLHLTSTNPVTITYSVFHIEIGYIVICVQQSDSTDFLSQLKAAISIHKDNEFCAFICLQSNCLYLQSGIAESRCQIPDNMTTGDVQQMWKCVAEFLQLSKYKDVKIDINETDHSETSPEDDICVTATLDES